MGLCCIKSESEDEEHIVETKNNNRKDSNAISPPKIVEMKNIEDDKKNIIQEERKQMKKNEQKLVIPSNLSEKLKQADKTLIVFGEEGSGKTDLIKLLLNSIENNSIENIRFSAGKNVDYLLDCQFFIEDPESNLTIDRNRSVSTRGLRFYFHDNVLFEDKKTNKLLIIDTPGIIIDRTANKDEEVIQLIVKSLEISKKPIMLFVQKSDSNCLYHSVYSSLDEISKYLKNKDCPILIALTFYAGSAVFTKKSLPFDPNLIKKKFKFNNLIFSCLDNHKKRMKFASEYEKSKKKAYKLLNYAFSL